MRQLFPEAGSDVDPLEVYSADDRTKPSGRPWVLCNMITSLDGAISVEGVSGGLGGPADKAVFAAIRGVADVIMVGAGTVIAENYRRPQTSPHVQGARIARGQTAIPALAIVTNSLHLSPDHRVFDEDYRPIIMTNASASAERRAMLADRAELVDTGETAVDLAAAVDELAERGHGVILVEGGPTLNGALIDADLFDELCLSLSPLVVGGENTGIVAGASSSPDRRFRLDRVLHSDDLTFLRYLRSR